MQNPYEYYRKALRHPKWRWVIIVLSLVYLISPLDFLPEIFLSLLGYIDDGVVIGVLAVELLQLLLRKE